MVSAFARSRVDDSGWTNEDVAYLVERILGGAPPLMVEAEIEAEIHHKVTWKSCPGCGTKLTPADVIGFCPECTRGDGAQYTSQFTKNEQSLRGPGDSQSRTKYKSRVKGDGGGGSGGAIPERGKRTEGCCQSSKGKRPGLCRGVPRRQRTIVSELGEGAP